MTREVYIYICLFVALLGYLFYMDYKEKAATHILQIDTPADGILTTEDWEKTTRYDMDVNADSIKVPPPVEIRTFTTKERDALVNPKEGTIIYLKDAEGIPHLEVFYRSKLRKELGLSPVWTWIDNPTFEAEEEERKMLEATKIYCVVCKGEIKNADIFLRLYRDAYAHIFCVIPESKLSFNPQIEDTK